MSTKTQTKDYNNNDRLFFLLDPNKNIVGNDPVRVFDAIIESLGTQDVKLVKIGDIQGVLTAKRRNGTILCGFFLLSNVIFK